MQQDFGSGIQLVRYRIFNTKLLVERWEHDKYLEKGVPKGWIRGPGGGLIMAKGSFQKSNDCTRQSLLLGNI